jgi:hypothetical protein
MHLPLKRWFPVLLFFLFLQHISFSQERYAIKGSVIDTAEKKVLHLATLALLNSSDSSLITYTRADKEGSFRFPSLTSGQYILMITYPGYANWIDRVSIAAQDLNLGTVGMSTRVKVLQEIVLGNKVAAIRIKGDTTEYAADSFKVAPNADVQELLRSMPDFQINSRGEIVTQGEKVNKVLVDGEEFFSDDPAIVTKNLRADAVDKVQVFDKKSDQAVFTGIDDGQRSKTINLKLKEDKTRGYFGKIDAGSNFNSLHTGKVMANLFQGKRKMASYFTTDNTRFEGLNWDEMRNYSDGGNMSTEIMEGGGISISMTSDDVYSENIGLPNQQTAGLFYGNKKGNTSTSNSFQYQHLGTQSVQNTDIITLLSGTTQKSNNVNQQEMNKRRFKVNSINEWGTDSTGLFKTTIRASAIHKEAGGDYTAATYREDGTLINSSSRVRSFLNDNNNVDGSLSYRRKMAKKGRTMSLSTSFTLGEIRETGSLLSDNLFYDLSGVNYARERIDQQKEDGQTSFSLKGNINYTEPISKNSFLIFQYNINLGRNESERNTFGKSSGGQYLDPVDSLSNHFIYVSSQHNGSLSYRYVKKKFNMAIGSGLGTSVYKLEDLVVASNRKISFFNILPNASFTFNPAAQKRINFSYNGTTTNPQLNQLQPLRDNTDPLNLTIGNPNLKQGFTHSFNLGANQYKVLKNRSFGLWGQLSFRDNSISTTTQILSNGKRLNSYVNVDGVYNGNVSFSFGQKIYKSLNGNIRLGYSAGRNNNFINDVKNTTNYKSVSYTTDLSIWGEKMFTMYASFTARKNFTTSTILSGFNGDFWSYDVWSRFRLNFKKAKLNLELEPTLTAFERTPVFPESRNSFVVSPTIRKTFGKNDAWEARFYVYDVFNKVQEASRNASTNFITSSTVNVIKRFALLGLTYNFSKNGKPTSMGF